MIVLRKTSNEDVLEDEISGSRDIIYSRHRNNNSLWFSTASVTFSFDTARVVKKGISSSQIGSGENLLACPLAM